MSSLFVLRLQKIAFAALRPSCWTAAFRGVFPSCEHARILRGVDCDRVLDVGANRGQFALLMQVLRPGVPLVSFEPLPGEAAVYRSILASRPGVQLCDHALGEVPGTASIHVSARPDSSSLLPIGELQTRIFPDTAESRSMEVEVRRLDDLPDLWRPSRRILLKLDVQGFELSVLKGAVETLRHCQWVYCECSEVPLYTGQALRTEIEAFLAGHGFSKPLRANETMAEGRLVQADYLFERRAV